VRRGRCEVGVRPARGMIGASRPMELVWLLWREFVWELVLAGSDVGCVEWLECGRFCLGYDASTGRCWFGLVVRMVGMRLIQARMEMIELLRQFVVEAYLVLLMVCLLRVDSCRCTCEERAI
jgi:hypothetical protein